MRALLSKVLTGSMVAGAALLVSACGGSGDDAAVNNSADLGTDMTIDANDTTTVDAATGADANMAMDMNASDMNASGNATDAGGDNAMNGM
jgi:hypothetical protein